MLSTLKFGRHLCRYVTENRRINQVLSCGFKESFNNRTYHLYTLKKNLMAETNLVKNLQAVQNFSTANVDELIVKHYPDGGKFCVEIDGVGSAYLEYERKNDLVIIKHTEVPSELGGRGIGKVLAKEALEFVAKNDLQLDIKCSFVRNYVSKYEPKYIKYIIEK